MVARAPENSFESAEKTKEQNPDIAAQKRVRKLRVRIASIVRLLTGNCRNESIVAKARELENVLEDPASRAYAASRLSHLDEDAEEAVTNEILSDPKVIAKAQELEEWATQNFAKTSVRASRPTIKNLYQ